MYQNLRKRTEGFTIIEVLIVLAIAGLIMLIVFLAVPALQRNSRNNGRNNDAARVGSAVTECLANRNGQTSSCGTAAAINIDPTTLAQLNATGSPTFSTTATAGTTTAATVRYDAQCNTAGDAIGSSGTATPDKSFVVLFQLETSSTPIDRCISG